MSFTSDINAKWSLAPMFGITTSALIRELLLAAGCLTLFAVCGHAQQTKTADFNGDGFPDLAIGAPQQETNVGNSGAVHLLYGTANGPSASSSTLPPLSGSFSVYTAAPDHEFGETLATGNFDGDAYADLVISVPGDGSVLVCYGAAGFPGQRNEKWSLIQNPRRGPVVPERIYSALAVGDFNKDGLSDLAIGHPAASNHAGLVLVLYGSTTGLYRSDSNYLWNQNSPGMLGTFESGDRFGEALTAGDFNGDGFYDLAIGAPGETWQSQEQGVVHVVYGSSVGLLAAGNQLWSQENPGILGSAEDYDHFGASLAAANFGNGIYDDLAIGVPGKDLHTGSFLGGLLPDTGAVQVLYGSANGLTHAGNQLWTLEGLYPNPDVLSARAQFGISLAAGDFGAALHSNFYAGEITGYADLAIGVPFIDGVHTVDGIIFAIAYDVGGVQVLYGSANGLTSTGNQWIARSTVDYWSGENRELFGRSLAAADFGRTSHADLVIGAPGANHAIGKVDLIYGSSAGLDVLTAPLNQSWIGQHEGSVFGLAIASRNGKACGGGTACSLPPSVFQ